MLDLRGTSDEVAPLSYQQKCLQHSRSDANLHGNKLENIEEEISMNLPSPNALFPAPEAPQEPMEFLSRSWSLSAIEVAKAYSETQCDGAIVRHEASSIDTTPFVFAPSMTSQLVMDRIMEHSLFAPRRNSHSSGPLVCHSSGLSSASPPPSPTDDLQHCQVKIPLRGKSVGRWFKDHKERKKELTRAHNAQVHAAISVAGVAAAVAAVAAATAASNTAEDNNSSKTSMAVASAASLVAAQCVEIAEIMGADHEQVSAVVSSAVNVKTAGDILTLTAAAATALRGAATLKARSLRETSKSHATVAPYDKGITFSGDLAASEDSEAAENYTQELLARGCEFLKRSKNGEIHWRLVSVHVEAQGQVIVKVRSKHMGGALRKKRKGRIVEVVPDINAWPGRCLLDNGEQRRYFGLKTEAGLLEFECKSEYEHKLWTQGVSHLLSLHHTQ